MTFAGVIAALLLSQGPIPHPDPAMIHMGARQQKVIPLPPEIRAVAVANEVEGCNVVERLIVLDSKERRSLLIIADGTGRGELLLFADSTAPRRHPLRVTDPGCDLTICDLCRMFPADRTSRVRSIGDTVYVVGTFGSLEEALAAAELLQHYPQLKVVATLGERPLRRALLEASYLLWRGGLSHHRVVVRDGFTAIAGPPLTGDAAARAEKVTAPIRTALDRILAMQARRPAELPAVIASPCASGS